MSLNPLSDYQRDDDYHYHLQGLFYSLMREAEREEVHDRTGYKYFCFSNLFPYSARIEHEKELNLLVSTPEKKLVYDVVETLGKRIRAGGEAAVIKIGGMKFTLASIKGPFFLPELRTVQPIKVRSSTPIIIRIPKWRYEDYGIKSERPYMFWRETIALEAFVKQLRDNMEKKIARFGSRENVEGYPTRRTETPTTIPLPEVVSYRFLKIVSKPITVKGEKQLVIGSIWELEFVPQNERESSNLEFAVESGFGERNSLGFGFMNPV